MVDGSGWPACRPLSPAIQPDRSKKRIMRSKFIATAAAAAFMAAAIPGAAGAEPFHGAQSAAGNPTYNDVIGFSVAAGQANYQAAGFTTGDSRSVLKGDTAELIAFARTNVDSTVQDWYASLDQPIPVTP